MKLYKFYFNNNYDDENNLQLIEQFLTGVIKNFNLRWSINNTIPKMKMRQIKNALFDEFTHCLSLDRYRKLYDICEMDILYQMCLSLLKDMYGYY